MTTRQARLRCHPDPWDLVDPRSHSLKLHPQAVVQHALTPRLALHGTGIREPSVDETLGGVQAYRTFHVGAADARASESIGQVGAG